MLLGRARRGGDLYQVGIRLHMPENHLLRRREVFMVHKYPCLKRDRGKPPEVASRGDVGWFPLFPGLNIDDGTTSLVYWI